MTHLDLTMQNQFEKCDAILKLNQGTKVSQAFTATQVSKIRGHLMGLGFKPFAADQLLTEAMDFVECYKRREAITQTDRLIMMARKEIWNDESESHAVERMANVIKGAIPHLIDYPEHAKAAS